MNRDDRLRRRMANRMSFLNEAVTLRELRGWPNDPVANASIIYEMYGWPFDDKDAALIKAESSRTNPDGE
jgi:hypothetical protein